MFLMKIEKRRGRDLCILTFDSVVAPSKSKTKKSSGWIIIHLSLREWFNVLESATSTVSLVKSQMVMTETPLRLNTIHHQQCLVIVQSLQFTCNEDEMILTLLPSQPPLILQLSDKSNLHPIFPLCVKINIKSFSSLSRYFMCGAWSIWFSFAAEAAICGTVSSPCRYGCRWWCVAHGCNCIYFASVVAKSGVDSVLNDNTIYIQL